MFRLTIEILLRFHFLASIAFNSATEVVVLACWTHPASIWKIEGAGGTVWWVAIILGKRLLIYFFVNYCSLLLFKFFLICWCLIWTKFNRSIFFVLKRRILNFSIGNKLLLILCGICRILFWSKRIWSWSGRFRYFKIIRLRKSIVKIYIRYVFQYIPWVIVTDDAIAWRYLFFVRLCQSYRSGLFDWRDNIWSRF